MFLRHQKGSFDQQGTCYRRCLNTERHLQALGAFSGVDKRHRFEKHRGKLKSRSWLREVIYSHNEPLQRYTSAKK